MLTLDHVTPPRKRNMRSDVSAELLKIIAKYSKGIIVLINTATTTGCHYAIPFLALSLVIFLIPLIGSVPLLAIDNFVELVTGNSTEPFVLTSDCLSQKQLMRYTRKIY